MNRELVSVIIPTKNRKECLRECLNSVIAQTNMNIEIVVIDNNSEDGTIEMLHSNYPDVILICNKSNKGAAFAKNQGIKKASGRFVWFLDSDSEVLNKHCLSNTLEILNNNPDIGSIGGEVYRSGDTLTLRKKSSFPNAETHTSDIEYGEGAKLIESAYLPTANCLMKKSLIQQLGGFDPVYFYLVEDTELGFKISKAGLLNVIDFRTVALHKINLEKRRSDIYLSHRNRIRFVIKNMSLLKIVFLPLLDIFYLIDTRKIKSLKKGDIRVTKHLPGIMSNKWVARFFLIKLLVVGVAYSTALIAGYIWNLAYLPHTLWIRISSPNYLADL